MYEFAYNEIVDESSQAMRAQEARALDRSRVVRGPLFGMPILIKDNIETADPMPTARRMLSGVASALFMARRIQAGLAANSRPSSTNRIPKPMRKSANAMDLIGLKSPA